MKIFLSFTFSFFHSLFSPPFFVYPISMGAAFSHHSSADAAAQHSKPGTRCAKSPTWHTSSRAIWCSRGAARKRGRRTMRFRRRHRSIARLSLSDLLFFLFFPSSFNATPTATVTPTATSTASQTSTAPSSSSRPSAGSSRGPPRGPRGSSSGSERRPSPPSPVKSGKSRWRPSAARGSTRPGWPRSILICSTSSRPSPGSTTREAPRRSPRL